MIGGPNVPHPHPRICCSANLLTKREGTMRRISLLSCPVALALVVPGESPASAHATHAAGSPPIGLVTPHFISDSFAAAAIDRNVWGWYGTNQPDNVAFSQSGGALNVSVSSTATNNFNASLGTRCKVRGDFDATLSYRLVEWPATNGVWVSLMQPTPAASTSTA